MEFYRAEYLMDNFKSSNEKETKTRREQEEEQKTGMDMSSMKSQQSKMMNSYTGKSNMGNFNMPKF